MSRQGCAHDSLEPMEEKKTQRDQRWIKLMQGIASCRGNWRAPSRGIGTKTYLELAALVLMVRPPGPLADRAKDMAQTGVRASPELQGSLLSRRPDLCERARLTVGTGLHRTAPGVELVDAKQRSKEALGPRSNTSVRPRCVGENGVEILFVVLASISSQALIQ